MNIYIYWNGLKQHWTTITISSHIDGFGLFLCILGWSRRKFGIKSLQLVATMALDGSKHVKSKTYYHHILVNNTSIQQQFQGFLPGTCWCLHVFWGMSKCDPSHLEQSPKSSTSSTCRAWCLALWMVQGAESYGPQQCKRYTGLWFLWVAGHAKFISQLIMIVAIKSCYKLLQPL
jgi:hypothetical protein